jgi:hypothetical protein
MDFADMTISNVLHDLPFSRKKPLKSAEDYYAEVFKNRIKP